MPSQAGMVDATTAPPRDAMPSFGEEERSGRCDGGDRDTRCVRRRSPTEPVNVTTASSGHDRADRPADDHPRRAEEPEQQEGQPDEDR